MDDVSWFKKAIIYHIFIDRFAGYKTTDWNKADFLGGNIKEITNKLPYFIELGVNTLWLSPFYETSAYHGYHITDFYKVDPHFGNIKDIKELIKQAHRKDIRVIADFVPNHCSKHHPYFKDAQQNKNSEYRKWFYFKKWPDNYLCFLSIKEIPKINLDYIPAREHIKKAALHWLDLGFDGFRLDHVIGPKHSFWKYFRNEIKQRFPHAVLIGEAWMQGIRFNELRTINVRNKYLKWLYGKSSDLLLISYVGELDGVLDFRFQQIIEDFVVRKSYSSKQVLQKKIQDHFKKYPKDYYLPTFLDNHDMDRFLFKCNADKTKLMDAAKIQFSVDQPIIIYYGTEAGMTQESSMWHSPFHGDLQARQPMNWDNPDKELLSFYKKHIYDEKTK